ncbi:MAG TPA: hypothetical protein VGN86_02905 [Pyrinomonadaceae bacterium]|jgi:TolA-binding protein|nr:hypothetical protein [Pyrinomonadaceae bacterium]
MKEIRKKILTVMVTPLRQRFTLAKVNSISIAGSLFGAALLACVMPVTTMASANLSRAGHSSNHPGSFFIHILESNQDPTSQSKDTAAHSAQFEQMQKTIDQLTAEVERLRKKVAELEHIRSILNIRDRITKEEQRAEALQAQLLAIAEKETPLQVRMDQINEQVRPESLAQLQVLGSLRPEEVREATRRSLTNEKQRVQNQLDLLQQGRTRLQASLTNCDLVIQRLRLKVQ